MRDDIGDPQHEIDIHVWAMDTLEAAHVPETIRDNIFEAGMRFRPVNATILWLGPWMVEAAQEVMTRAEKQISVIAGKSDRELLEDIYKKLYPA